MPVELSGWESNAVWLLVAIVVFFGLLGTLAFFFHKKRSVVPVYLPRFFLFLVASVIVGITVGLLTSSALLKNVIVKIETANDVRFSESIEPQVPVSDGEFTDIYGMTDLVTDNFYPTVRLINTDGAVEIFVPTDSANSKFVRFERQEN